MVSQPDLAVENAILEERNRSLAKKNMALLVECANLKRRNRSLIERNKYLATCRNQATAARDKYRKQLLKEQK